MSSRLVIASVMDEVGRDIASASITGFTWGCGRREAAKNSAATRIDWIPLRGAISAPQHAGRNPRPIANRWTRWDVRCWGADMDQAEQLLEFLVRALHLVLTGGGYKAGGEEWTEVGMLSAGEAVVVSIELGIPVLDRTQPTARPTSVSTNGTITHE